MELREEKVLHRAVSQLGVLSQLDMVTEECGELITAINKAKRAGIVRSTILPPTEERGMHEIYAYNELCQEVADVKIMVAQLEIMLDKERIDISVVRKIKRLETRLNNGQKEKTAEQTI